MPANRQRCDTLVMRPSLLAAAVLTLMAGGCSDGGGRDLAAELRRRIEASTDPTTFAFDYEVTNQMLDCALPSRRFRVEVDGSAGTVALRNGPGSRSPLALRIRDRSLIHRSALRAGMVGTEWVDLDEAATAAHDQSVGILLGRDATGYVLASQLPDSMRVIARAALEYSSEVQSLEGAPFAEVDTGGYRIIADPELFARAVAEDTGEAERPPDPSELPTIDVWVNDEGSIARVVVRAGRSPIEESDGWTLTSAPPGTPVTTPSDEEVTDASDLDPTNLTSRRVGACSLGE